MAGKEAVVRVHTEIDRGSVSCETAYDILPIGACTVTLAPPKSHWSVYISYFWRGVGRVGLSFSIFMSFD